MSPRVSIRIAVEGEANRGGALVSLNIFGLSGLLFLPILLVLVSACFAHCFVRTVIKNLVLIAALTTSGMVAQNQRTRNQPVPNSAKPEATWRFAVSGDSRNCGDVVVPAIAADATKQNAAFYWHLGDFRWIADIDEDMQCGPIHLDGMSGRIKYGLTAWKDFRENQAASFGSMAVFLGIGNHEMIFHPDREDFLHQFVDWLDSPLLRSQRLKDDPEDRSPHTYYHWVDRGIDFINLDNASDNEFTDTQLRWFEGVVARDLPDASVKTLVVGMHKALPNSLAASHSMNESARGIDTGQNVYKTLLDAQGKGKHVYILASHSHYYADNIYGTDYWRTHGGVLPGWIVGTAGAHRYTLPDSVPPGPHARTSVYGYLLATAHLGGAADGTVEFTFVELQPSQVPDAVQKRFDNGFVAWCFANNRDPDYKAPTCQK